METATWDESNPEDIICVVGANGKSQAIHGRTVAETQGRIPKVMVSEFRMSQPEADEFAQMAADQRGKPSELEKVKADLDKAQGTVRALNQRSQKLEEALAAAEKDRDAAVAARDKATTDLAAAKTALQQAQQQITAMKPPAPPPAKPAETSDDGKADKAS